MENYIIKLNNKEYASFTKLDNYRIVGRIYKTDYTFRGFFKDDTLIAAINDNNITKGLAVIRKTIKNNYHLYSVNVINRFNKIKYKEEVSDEITISKVKTKSLIKKAI